MKTIHWAGILVAVLIIAFLVIPRAYNLGGYQAYDLRTNQNSTGTIAMVGNAATQVLAANPARVWLYLQSVNATTAVSCVFTSSSAGMVAGSGITLGAAGWTSSTEKVFDSGKSNVDWKGAVNCVASATTTLSVYEK